MKSFTLTEVLTALVALYGAVLSTIIFVKNQAKNKRTIELLVYTGLLTGQNVSRDLMLFFKISNPGNRDVIVNLPQLRLSNGYNVFLPDMQSNVNFPCKVTDGSCIYAWYPIHALQADLIKQGMKGSIEIQGIIEDQTNVTYKAKRKLTLDLV